MKRQTKAVYIQVVKPYANREEATFARTLPPELARPMLAKPTFNSGFENNLYYVLKRCVFSRYALVANIDIVYLFDDEALPPKLTSRERKFLRSHLSHVDICVANSKTLEPFLGIEVDSQYHGDDHQRRRDWVKDRIFRKAGIPLLRIEPGMFYQQSAMDRCRNVRREVIDAIRQIGGRYDRLVEKLEAG